MGLRRYILSTLVFLTFVVCLFTGHAFYLYFNPSFAGSLPNLILSILIYPLFGFGSVFTLFLIRKRAKQKIKERYSDELLEQTYKNIVESSGVSSIVVDKNGDIKFVSKNIGRLSGFEAEELLGIPLIKCIPADFHEPITNVINNMSTTASYEDSMQVLIITKAQQRKWVSCRMYPVKDSAGNIQELQLMLWDIDKEKKLQLQLDVAEMENSHQQHLLQTVINLSPAIVYLKKPDGEYVLTNSKMKEVTGTRTDKEVTLFMAEYNSGERAEKFLAEERTVVEDKQVVTSEEDFFHADGKVSSFWLMKLPIFDENGNVEYICGFYTDVTVMKQSEQIIVQARKEAEQAKEAQELFLANMSHEIRTPMNGIIGLTNLVMGSTLSIDQRDYMESIQESAQNLLSIINDLLDFSKIKSGKFHLEVADFNPDSAIKKAIYPLNFKANEKNISLKCYIDTTVPNMIKGDALRLHQVITNLVGNAIKFTHQGLVEVKVYAVSKTDTTIILGIDVIDSGIGIIEEKLKDVFESYAQSDTNTSRLYGGTGLGLAIVKQLAELQDGTVSVKSEIGKGSTFTVHIPYAITQTDEGDIDNTQAMKREYKELMQGIKVLVAEDNLINQKVVQHTLAKQNVTVALAANGQLAIDMLKTDVFDIVLMDLQMPELDGYKATEYIRQVMKSNIPIVAMTADALKGECDKCFEVGMNGYITKPFEPNELYDKILDLVQVAQ